MEVSNRINIDEPRWDQSTYWGRCRHFFYTTNPMNVLCTEDELEKAKDIVQRYRWLTILHHESKLWKLYVILDVWTIKVFHFDRRREPLNISEDDLWRAKNIYDSAFHPDTGEKMIIIGRMSAQVPMCMFIGGCMLTFYKYVIISVESKLYKFQFEFYLILINWICVCNFQKYQGSILLAMV